MANRENKALKHSDCSDSSDSDMDILQNVAKRNSLKRKWHPSGSDSDHEINKKFKCSSPYSETETSSLTEKKGGIEIDDRITSKNEKKSRFEIYKKLRHDKLNKRVEMKARREGQRETEEAKEKKNIEVQKNSTKWNIGEVYTDTSSSEDEVVLKKLQAYKPKREDVNSIRLSKHKLEKFVHIPFFDRIAIGCFVRIGVGQQPNIYQVAEVIGVYETAKVYVLGNTKTNKGVKVRYGAQEKCFRLKFVSNEHLTDDEFHEWFKTTKAAGQPFPTRKHIEKKQADIKEAMHYEFNEEDVDKIVAGKARLKQLDKIEERASHLDKMRTSSISNSSYPNHVMKKENMERAEKAIVAELEANKGKQIIDPLTRISTRPTWGFKCRPPIENTQPEIPKVEETIKPKPEPAYRGFKCRPQIENTQPEIPKVEETPKPKLKPAARGFKCRPPIENTQPEIPKVEKTPKPKLKPAARGFKCRPPTENTQSEIPKIEETPKPKLKPAARGFKCRPPIENTQPEIPKIEETPKPKLKPAARGFKCRPPIENTQPEIPKVEETPKPKLKPAARGFKCRPPTENTQPELPKIEETPKPKLKPAARGFKCRPPIENTQPEIPKVEETPKPKLKPAAVTHFDPYAAHDFDIDIDFSLLTI